MFSGINQSGMFSNASFSNYYDRLAKTGRTNSPASAQATEETQELSARDAFVKALKERGMSDEKIAGLPESFWKKAEKKAENNKNFNFGDDKELSKLADFLAKKADVVKSSTTDEATTGDSANISQEAKDAAAAATAEEEAEESDIVTVDTEEETDTEGTGSTGFASIFEEFQDKLNKVLLEGLGLGNLSEMAANSSFMSYSASFEISYQSMVAVAGENGMTMQETSFSMKGTFEFMSMGQMNRPWTVEEAIKAFQLQSGKDEGTDEVDANDPFAALKDYFSPEKTANRILDFSLGFFGNSSAFKEGGDTEESRGSFAEMIGAAIQKGFDQALGTLGALPKETSDEVDDTHKRVFDGLDNFVKTGSKDGKEAQPYSSFQAYSSVFEMNYSSTTTYFSADETADALEGLYNKYFNKGYGNAAQTQIPTEQSPEVADEQEQDEEVNVSPIDISA